MNGHTDHPGTDELAEFGAGVADGARGDWVAAHIADCPECASLSARLDEVSALLAAVPMPPMPEDVSDRILAAIQAQPRRGAVPDSGGNGETVLKPRRSRWFRTPAGALLTAAAGIVLAVVGYQLSDSSGPASPAASGTHASGPPGVAAGPNRHSINPAMRNPTPGFFIAQTKVNYRTTTLAEQVRQQVVAAQHLPIVTSSPPVGGSRSPSASSSPGTAVSGPDRVPAPKPVVNCVMHLTGDNVPVLVEQATYQSRAVYVIVMRNHAWLVTTECSPAHPDIMASMVLRPPVG